MNKTELTDYVVVFKTGKLVEIDSAVNALKKAGLPYYTREETSGGLIVAMPAAPSMGPGIWWSILIPEQSLSQAKEVFSQLPFDIKTKVGVWDFGPTKKVKIGFQIYALIILLITFVVSLIALIGKLK